MSISISISTSTVSYRLPGTFISTTRYLHIDYQVPSYRLPGTFISTTVPGISYCQSLVARRSTLIAFRLSPTARVSSCPVRVACVVLSCRRCTPRTPRTASPCRTRRTRRYGAVRYGRVQLIARIAPKIYQLCLSNCFQILPRMGTVVKQQLQTHYRKSGLLLSNFFPFKSSGE